MTKPNILLIIVDCLRSDYLIGQQGQAETSFLNSIIREGVVFTDMISAMSITTPNFTSILSGRYPVEHGVRFLSSRPPETSDLTLIPHLKKQGYHTYAMMTGPLFLETGLGHGFDFYECRNRSDYLDENWGEQFLQLIKQKKIKEPWFILLHLWELHQPRHVSAEYHNHPGTPYEKALASLDKQLEQLWQVVEKTTTRPVIGSLTGDHGEWVETGTLDELLRKGKAWLRKLLIPNKPKANWHGYHIYDYLVRVPLVIWGETISGKNRFISQQIRQIDLLPTLIEATGLPQPEPVTGHSVWPLADGQSIPEEPAFLEASGDTILLQSPKWVLGVRHAGWKFFYRPQMPGYEKLFDLKNDSAEQNNLAKQFPQKASKLKEMIENRYINRGTRPTEEDIDLSITEQRLRDLGYF